jgi:hypothetical protein
MAVNYGNDENQVKDWLKWCLEFGTHKICMRLEMAKVIFTFARSDTSNPTAMRNLILIKDTLQKYDVYGKNNEMIFLQLNEERAASVLKSFNSEEKSKSEEYDTILALNDLNLNWHISYHYKFKEDQNNFIYYQNHTKHVVDSLGFKIKSTIGDGNCMLHSILLCLVNVDYMTHPNISQKEKGFLEMRRALCNKLKTAYEAKRLHPYLECMDDEELARQLTLIPKQKKNKKWEYLQLWATELFAELYTCNIMIVDVGISKRSDQVKIAQEGKPVQCAEYQYAVRCGSTRVFDPVRKTIYILYTGSGENAHYQALFPLAVK